MDTYTQRTVAAAPQALYSVEKILNDGCLSRSHLYNLVSKGHFPPPVLRYGTRFTRWCAADVQAWLADPQGWIDQHAAIKKAEHA
jgi:predicted DNA-binding transcriptional regulator AlpA